MKLGITGDGTRRRRGRHDRQRGAVLVEFGIIAILLFTLLFGIVEFGYYFFQRIDVRHGAREAARLAAVNFKPTSGATPAAQQNELLAEACDRLDTNSASSNVRIRFTRIDTDADGDDGEIGDQVEVEVEASFSGLTGFFPGLDGPINSEVVLRSEQSITWAEEALEDCP